MKLVAEKWFWGPGAAGPELREWSYRHEIEFVDACEVAGVSPEDEELTLAETAEPWEGYPEGTPILTGLTVEDHPFWVVQVEFDQDDVDEVVGREFTFLGELRHFLALYRWGSWYPVLEETDRGVKITAVGHEDEAPTLPEGCEEIGVAVGVDLEGRLRLVRRVWDPAEPFLATFAPEGGETAFRRRIG